MTLKDFDTPAFAGTKLEKIITFSALGIGLFVLFGLGIYCWSKKRDDSRARFAARQERVRVSIYDTSNPPQFGQTECIVCWHEFENTQTYASLPCGHIFCVECISKYQNIY
jgi:hypothetical protein